MIGEAVWTGTAVDLEFTHADRQPLGHVCFVRGFVSQRPPEQLPGPHVYVEQRVPLMHELAVQVARRPSGEMRAWPLVETVQADGICVEVVAPAPRTSPALAAEAERIATTLA